MDKKDIVKDIEMSDEWSRLVDYCVKEANDVVMDLLNRVKQEQKENTGRYIILNIANISQVNDALESYKKAHVNPKQDDRITHFSKAAENLEKLITGADQIRDSKVRCDTVKILKNCYEKIADLTRDSIYIEKDKLNYGNLWGMAKKRLHELDKELKSPTKLYLN